MSVLHPPIQEEVTIRKNIALGPTGLGQYFPVLSLPLGLGGVIRIHFLIRKSFGFGKTVLLLCKISFPFNLTYF